MNRKLYIFIVTMLMLIEIGSLFLTYKSFQNKSNENKDIMLLNNNMFALMIDDGNGNYEESSSTAWPGDNYVYNKEKSGCVNRSGDVLENVLDFDRDTNTALLTTKTSAYCYLYFDLKTQTGSLIEDCEGSLGECLTNNPPKGLNPEEEGGLKRYQGTNEEVENYICFGTSDKNTCQNNTDAYMYRIIGINSDNKVKIIKKEALNSFMQWYANANLSKAWHQSTIYANINGTSFLNNTTYVPNEWKSKIATVTWKYGDNTTQNISASGLYELENNWSTTVSAKIGLIYAHDYYYGLPGGNNCYNEEEICKTSWLHLSNNDSGAPHSNEWTMSRYGIFSTTNYYYAYSIYSNGFAGIVSINSNSSVRPVFYLDSSINYISGTGTYDNPFILQDSNSSGDSGDSSDSGGTGNSLATCNGGLGECLTAHPAEGLTTTMMEAGLYRFQGTNPKNHICFGTSDEDTCTGNTDVYMYRIIGIDSSGRLKLIKKETLKEKLMWHIDTTTDIEWPESTAYSQLNGSTFLSNPTYVPEIWKAKIALINWKYGSYLDNDAFGYNTTAAELYSKENAWTSIVSAKIGIMYMHDYYYAYQSGGEIDCWMNSNICKTSWIFTSKSHIGEYEMALSRKGYQGGKAEVYYLYSNGGVWYDRLDISVDVRPVFFLTNTVKYSQGSGTLEDPFIIK